MKKKNLPQPKKMTIDDLAIMVARGFSGVDKRLDGIDIRLDGIDIRLDNIDVRLDGIDIRLDNIDVRLNHMDDRFDDMDKRFDILEDNHFKKFTKLDKTVNILSTVVESNLKIKVPKV